MSTASPDNRDLARRLVALEAAGGPGTAAGRVCERLRVPLVRLAGAAGYGSLLSRAVAMAKAEDPSLDPVRVRPDGSLEHFDGVAAARPAAGAVVVAHLLELLTTFIGKPLTLNLVADAWPDAARPDPASGENI